MSDSLQITIGFVFLLLVYGLTRYGIVWRIRRSYRLVIQDLMRRQARNEGSAVDLHYAHRSILTIGLRDFRTKALQELVEQGFARKTADGRYYLCQNGDELLARFAVTRP
jgi:hypothetical protein